MSTKEQILSWLAELPDESPVWKGLHDEARQLRDIAAAEEDIRAGREKSLEEAQADFEKKWARRPSRYA